MHRLKACVTLVLACCAYAASGADWSDYGGAADASQYSPLKQIDRSNVRKLRVAWTYPTADGGRYLFNPLEAHGVLYVLAKKNSVVALDAATGREIWVHPNAPGPVTKIGISYWESADGSDRRLLYANADFLVAIDARTGKSIPSFGAKGRVDLRQGLGRDPSKISVQSMAPGRVFENLIIMGSATNQEYDSAPGDIRAFDVRTGALVWTFHTIPHKGEFGYDTWPPDAWKKVGGANDWAEMSLDKQRGVVYIPTASPKYNFYGANRPGANLFGDCLLALDARTGKRLWHFQMVHHDIWDYDNATAPKLLTVTHGGKKVDIVAQAGKTGFLYVFNRATGEPLWPIEERPVPKSTMPGEQTSPTQPFPVWPRPFARQKFTAEDLSPYIEDPAERARWRDEIQGARNEGIFTPPGTKNTIEMPGNNGGANFGGAAVDPARGWLFVVSKDYPAMLKLRLNGPAPADPRDAGYKTPFGFMVTSSGLSAIKPPWTTLTAYDLNSGKIRWQIPLGDVPELAAKGIKNTGSHFPKVGPVVTAGGLIFTGTRDRFVRALDETTGKVLWEAEVGAGLEGMPAVYAVDGKESVVFCAAATSSSHIHAAPRHPADRAPVAGAYVAFALPDIKADVKSLYKESRWTELASALEANGDARAPAFYRGVVAAVFNENARAVPLLKSAIAAAPHSGDAYEAYEWLAHIYLRTGRYREFVADMEARWKAFPNKHPNKQMKGEQAAVLGFRGLPDQITGNAMYAKLPHAAGSIFIPVSIDGHAATYFFDTGAWVSCMSESEARRLGLAIHDASGTTGTSVGAQIGFRTATAAEVVVGGTHFTNVSFYVFRDDQEPWSALPPGRRGLIGIPVILGLRSLRWARNGTVEVGMKSGPLASDRSNLFFENDHLMLATECRRRQVAGTLDTGAETTDLYAGFAKQFADLVNEAGKKDRTEVRGVGHAETFDSMTLPEVKFRIGDVDTALRPAHMLLKQIGPKCCNFGMDLLKQARAFRIDFGAMRLEMEGGE